MIDITFLLHAAAVLSLHCNRPFLTYVYIPRSSRSDITNVEARKFLSGNAGVELKRSGVKK